MGIGGREFISVSGFDSIYVWIDRVAARLPQTAGKEMLDKIGKNMVRSIRLNIKADTIYGSEHPGRLGKSFAVESKGKFRIAIISTHPGARAANDGMMSFKRGKFRRRFPGGAWRTIPGRGKVMTKSRAMHFVEHAVIDVTKSMDGVIEKSMRRRGFT